MDLGIFLSSPMEVLSGTGLSETHASPMGDGRPVVAHRTHARSMMSHP